MKKGKLIVIEGACDGIGKSTQYELLKNHLENDGISILTHHFPSYGTEQGALATNYLKGLYGDPKDISPYFINSLYAIDRAITWNTKLKSVYDKGDTILLDRYTTSSLIYQSAFIEDEEEKRNFIDYVCDFEYNKLGIPVPDKVIFLTAPFESIMKLKEGRSSNDGVKGDIHETNNDFMKKVYKSALFVANYLSWDIVDITKDGNILSKEEIHNKIYKLL